MDEKTKYYKRLWKRISAARDPVLPREVPGSIPKTLIGGFNLGNYIIHKKRLKHLSCHGPPKVIAWNNNKTQKQDSTDT